MLAISEDISEDISDFLFKDFSDIAMMPKYNVKSCFEPFAC